MTVVPMVEMLFSSPTFIVFGSFFLFLYLFFRRRFLFWSSQGVKGPSPVFLVGTLHKYGKGGIHDVDDAIMKQYGTLVGVYDSWKPALMIGDPDFIKEVTVTKFSSFCN